MKRFITIITLGILAYSLPQVPEAHQPYLLPTATNNFESYGIGITLLPFDYSEEEETEEEEEEEEEEICEDDYLPNTEGNYLIEI